MRPSLRQRHSGRGGSARFRAADEGVSTAAAAAAAVDACGRGWSCGGCCQGLLLLLLQQRSARRPVELIQERDLLVRVDGDQDIGAGGVDLISAKASLQYMEKGGLVHIVELCQVIHINRMGRIKGMGLGLLHGIGRLLIRVQDKDSVAIR